MKFIAERTRAAGDLLARVPLTSARHVTDLGCGPGNSSALLLRRFPSAELVGIDTSEAMLAHAREAAPGALFVRGDIGAWAPDEPVDLIFCNAALQFVANHHRLVPRLASFLAPGCAFAAQMPSTAAELSHALMRMIAAEGPWASRLVPVAKTQPLIASIDEYYEWLRPVCPTIESLDHHLCLCLRQRRRRRRLLRRLRLAAVSRAARGRGALRLPRPLPRGIARGLSGAVRRPGAHPLPAHLHGRRSRMRAARRYIVDPESSTTLGARSRRRAA